MFKPALILMMLLAITIPLYAQNEADNDKQTESPAEAVPSSEDEPTEETAAAEKKKDSSFWDFVNKPAYADTVDEQQLLREKWKKFLGIDVFLPYFKAKEVEHWIKERTSIRLFKMKGSPELENNQIQYIFKTKF